MSGSMDTKEASNPASEQKAQEATRGWLEALNGFLERAFLRADVDTGC